jgi:sterol desaturase/sphingolipid hydroxylase (fatty acid hydroxylase superfamily)
MNVHKLYRGAWARPRPALATHFVSMVALVATLGVHGSALGVVTAFLAGWLAWTFYEYAFHRWILHSRSPVLWKALHRDHHAMKTMHDDEHRLMHPLVAVPMMAATALVLHAVHGPALAGVGYWFGYLVYELIHFVHHDETLTAALMRFAYFRRRTAFHHTHHFHNARANYGFTFELWDAVFGTLLDPGALAAHHQPQGKHIRIGDGV